MQYILFAYINRRRAEQTYVGNRRRAQRQEHPHRSGRPIVRRAGGSGARTGMRTEAVMPLMLGDLYTALKEAGASEEAAHAAAEEVAALGKSRSLRPRR